MHKTIYVDNFFSVALPRVTQVPAYIGKVQMTRPLPTNPYLQGK
jgi:hypothetical protein